MLSCVSMRTAALLSLSPTTAPSPPLPVQAHPYPQPASASGAGVGSSWALDHSSTLKATLYGHEVMVTLRGVDFASVKAQVEQAS